MRLISMIMLRNLRIIKPYRWIGRALIEFLVKRTPKIRETQFEIRNNRNGPQNRK